MKRCPFCAEEIQDAAIKCRHCGSSLQQSAGSGGDSASLAEARALLMGGDKIGAVLHLKNRSGMALAEAKAFVESLGPTHAAQTEESRGTTTEDVPRGTNLKAGCFAGVLGLMAGGIFVVGGVFFCLTGIGMVIGIPFIIIGAMFLLSGLGVGVAGVLTDSVRGPCPYCARVVASEKGVGGVTCPDCQRRFVLRAGQFVRPD